ncbi:hypothetical protein GW916_06865 [bacterium]|nr:hypothetical protein [bacterium]
MRNFICILILAELLTFNLQAHAWGRRGHSLICQSAAYLASQDQKTSEEPFFLKAHSFDLGYYCNVPDIIWKRPATYKKESFNHFMDLELFDKQIGPAVMKDQPSPFKLERVEFDEKFKDLPEKYGRAWWRIRELDAKLGELTKKLKNTELTSDQRKELQAEWLVVAGATGHYIGDLAMPLHVSENYDGQLTGQKGIHHHFEETVVDELFLQKRFGLQEAVYKKALGQWSSYKKKAKGKDLLDLVKELSRDSQKSIEPLLKIDKKNDRKNLEKSSSKYRDMIVDRLAKGVLLQAYFYQSHLGWDFEEKKFYNFIEAPAFIETPKGPETKKK